MTDREKFQSHYNDLIALQHETDIVSINRALDGADIALELIDKLEREVMRLQRVEAEYVNLQIRTTPTNAA